MVWNSVVVLVAGLSETSLIWHQRCPRYPWSQGKFLCCISHVSCIANAVSAVSQLFETPLKQHQRYLWMPHWCQPGTSDSCSFFNSSELKGTVQRDFNYVFWHILIGLGLNTNRFYFKNFSEAPTILDQRTFSSRGSGEILSEKLFFSENLYK